MKKIFLLFIFILLNLNYGSLNAGRYKVSTKTYTATSGKTSCSSGQSASTNQTTSTTNGSAPTSGSFYCVKNDTTAPTGSVSYSTSSPTNGNVVVSITCSDSGAGCNMYAVSGWTISGNKYTKTFSTNASGNITIKDLVGNTRSVSYSISNIDKTAPTGLISYSITSPTNGNVVVSITCSDSGAGCNMYDVSGWTISGNKYTKTFSTNASGNITIKDLVGNTRSVSYSISNIDKTAPTGSVSYSTTSITNGNVIVSITCSDSGIGCDMYAISGWTISSNKYSKTFSTNASGNITIKDLAGNTKSVSYSISNIDETAPTGLISYSITSPTNGDVTVNITCSDSGIGCDMYAISGWTISDNKYSKTFSNNTSGSITIKDLASNTKSIPYSISNIDKIAPSGDINYSDINIDNGSVTVSITCSDIGGGGCDMYSISEWTVSGNIYSKTFFNNSSGSINIKDLAGNVKNITYTINNIDQIPPTGIVTYSPDSATNGEVIVSITCSDIGGVGCDMYTITDWTISDNTYSKTFYDNTSGSILIKDLGGNTENISYNVSSIDKISPSGTVTYSPDSATNGEVIVSITCSDIGGVGCDMYTITDWTISDNTYSKTFYDNTSGTITIKDLASNAKSIPYSISNIDKISPSGTVDYSITSPTNGDVIVTITCSDSGGSDCDMYNITDWTISDNKYSKIFSNNESGFINIKDLAGNTEKVLYSISNIDKTAPIGSVSYSDINWTNGDVTISIACSDSLGSGCDMYNITNWNISDNTYSKTFSYNESGSINIKDITGNTQNIPYSISNIDKTLPNINDLSGLGIEKNLGTILANENEDFSLAISENGGSPIISVEGYFENKDKDIIPYELESKGDIITNFSSLIRNINETDDNFREYSFMITKIEDEAGNILENNIEFNYNVVTSIDEDDNEITYDKEIVIKDFVSHTSGPYNSLILKVINDNYEYIYALPSIISSNISDGSISSISGSGNFVYEGQSNLPSSYKPSELYQGIVDYKTYDTLIYKRKYNQSYSEAELLIILEEIRKKYKNSVFIINEKFEEILHSDDTDKILKILSNELNGDIKYKNNLTNYWNKVDSNCTKNDIIIGNQIWAGCNSTIGNSTTISSKVCYNYDGDKISCNNISSISTESDLVADQGDNIFGKLYTGVNAVTACQNGWKVPTNEDWEILEGAVGCKENKEIGWRCNGEGWKNHDEDLANIIDIMNIPLAGLASSNRKLDFVGYSGTYWSSTEKVGSSSEKLVREFYYNSSKIAKDYESVNNSYSVRCIKE